MNPTHSSVEVQASQGVAQHVHTKKRHARRDPMLLSVSTVAKYVALLASRKAVTPSIVAADGHQLVAAAVPVEHTEVTTDANVSRAGADALYDDWNLTPEQLLRG